MYDAIRILLILLLNFIANQWMFQTTTLSEHLNPEEMHTMAEEMSSISETEVQANQETIGIQKRKVS